MRFIDGAGREYGLLEAACLGLSRGGDPLAPAGDDDLRPAIYAPESSYSYFAASVLAALFPGDIDPMLSLRLAETAFAEPPPPVPVDEGIAALDLGLGRTGSRVDQDAAFLAAILGQAARKGEPRLVLADGSGPEGAALAEALSGVEGVKALLLYPEGSGPAGLRPALLEREGGSVYVVEVRGGRDRIAGLISAAAGTRLGGCAASPAGPANPARFAARIVEFAAIFASSRSSAAGEFFFGLPEDDGIGLAACLWAWRLGVPLTGAVVPRRAGSRPLDAKDTGESAGRRLVALLDDERPGLVRSLVAYREVDPVAAATALDRLRARGERRFEIAGAEILAAAELLLDAGLRGHAKVFALMDRRPEEAEAGAASGQGAAAPDAVISPNLAELAAFLAR